jgi:hypothetical protein
MHSNTVAHSQRDLYFLPEPLTESGTDPKRDQSEPFFSTSYR